MKLEDIYTYYQTPQPVFLNQELAVCYVLSVLLEGNSYGTELVQKIEQDYPNYRLSDTVLYAALNFLEEEHCVTGYWQKVEGRGRPRRMYQLTDEMRPRAQELASLWKNYVKQSRVFQPQT
ncbi:MAG: PadR family transcriptional regulator [Leptolyngbyaceae cyanobacterium bins.302]|nr:PadR family transcriptional regulator [Leptolyngbyaceae cyanobacterium bins.302]